MRIEEKTLYLIEASSYRSTILDVFFVADSEEQAQSAFEEEYQCKIHRITRADKVDDKILRRNLFCVVVDDEEEEE